MPPTFRLRGQVGQQVVPVTRRQGRSERLTYGLPQWGIEASGQGSQPDRS
ncbi:MAG: hypothetical protein IPO15_20905 [Anaerolineae bacterium]|nr:hypothetical protein [Anaerolineae bacterium]